MAEVKTKRLDFDDYQVLTEGGVKVDPEKKEIEAIIIKSGVSKRKNFYSPEVLESAAPLFCGKKMYIDHPDPTSAAGQGKAARSLRDWVATITEAHYVPEEKGIGATIGIRDRWLWDKVADANKEGWLNEIGLSINAVGKTRIGKVGDETVYVVESIVRPHSVDFVTDASAGGFIQQVNESEITNVEELSMEKLTLQQLTESNPELVAQIEGGVREQVLAEAAAHIDEMANGFKAVIDEFIDMIEAETTEMYEGIAEGVNQVGITPDEADAGYVMTESAVPEGFGRVLADRDARIARLTESARVSDKGQETLAQRLEEVEDRMIQVTSTAVAERMLNESSIPDNFKARLLPSLIGRDPEEMEALIEEAEEFYGEIKEQFADRRNVVGLGGLTEGAEGADRQTKLDKLFGA